MTSTGREVVCCERKRRRRRRDGPRPSLEPCSVLRPRAPPGALRPGTKRELPVVAGLRCLLSGVPLTPGLPERWGGGRCAVPGRKGGGGAHGCPREVSHAAPRGRAQSRPGSPVISVRFAGWRVASARSGLRGEGSRQGPLRPQPAGRERPAEPQPWTPAGEPHRGSWGFGEEAGLQSRPPGLQRRKRQEEGPWTAPRDARAPSLIAEPGVSKPQMSARNNDLDL